MSLFSDTTGLLRKSVHMSGQRRVLKNILTPFKYKMESRQLHETLLFFFAFFFYHFFFRFLLVTRSTKLRYVAVTHNESSFISGKDSPVTRSSHFFRFIFPVLFTL